MEIGARTPSSCLTTETISPSPATQAPSGAVATELPVAASVQQASSASKTRNEDPSGGPAAFRETIERHLTVDPETRLLLSQVIERETGEVLSQVPDQGLLRVKAYAREIVARQDAEAERRRPGTLA